MNYFWGTQEPAEVKVVEQQTILQADVIRSDSMQPQELTKERAISF
jgi:hypothetical protein